MMNVINSNLIALDLEARNKIEILDYLMDLMVKENRITNKDIYKEVVLEREELISTAIGFGVGIPHGKSDTVKEPSLAFCRMRDMIDWSSEDQSEKVDLIFLIAVPDKSANEHLKILASLSRKLIDESFIQQLKEIQDKELLMKLLSEIN